MHDNHWLLELGRIALLLIVGAFGGLARLFNTDVPITTRNAIKHSIGGAVAALSGGAFALWMAPELNEKIILLVGLGVMAGFMGINAVSEVMTKRFHHQLQTHHLPPSKSADSDSSEVRRMMDSGEFTEEEIHQLIEEARHRRAKTQQRINQNEGKP
jgi:4-amino-4-deoxy-L-arabinose transferase-like glycosyltransferase